jgi:hypothetical protein
VFNVSPADAAGERRSRQAAPSGLSIFANHVPRALLGYRSLALQANEAANRVRIEMVLKAT